MQRYKNVNSLLFEVDSHLFHSGDLLFVCAVHISVFRFFNAGHTMLVEGKFNVMRLVWFFWSELFCCCCWAGSNFFSEVESRKWGHQFDLLNVFLGRLLCKSGFQLRRNKNHLSTNRTEMMWTISFGLILMECHHAWHWLSLNRKCPHPNCW